jgi:hypothetical protein
MARTVLRGTFQADTLESTNPLEINGMSQFEELRTVSRSSIIDLKANYGLSVLRDIVTTTGSATVSNAVGGSEYALVTTANGTDAAVLESAERGRYSAGFSGQSGMGIRAGSTPVGGQIARWGYFDNSNGFGYGRDATGMFIFIRKGGVDEVIRQADWSNDNLTGTGGALNPSGLRVNETNGNIFQIIFTYYGYGTTSFDILVGDANDRQRRIVVHRSRPSGALSVDNPNLPLRAEVRNSGTATALQLYIGGRQFSVEGEARPNRRISSERRISQAAIGTTFLPSVTLRRKAAYQSVSAKIEGFDIFADANMIFEVRVNGTLGGASYGTPTNYTATETGLEADFAATSITGGQVLYSGLLEASRNNSKGGQSIDALRFDFPALQPVTLCLRAITGTATATAVLRVKEEW